MKNFQLFLAFMISVFSFSQETISLWEEIPGNIINADYKEGLKYDNGQITSYSQVSTPTLSIYIPENQTSKTAVIICPGGGYTHLAINKEGFKMAKWLNELGIAAFVLKYRLPSEKIMQNKSIGPLQDVQEAIRYVRSFSHQFNVDPTKIGIMGFSAGGHLAASASTLFNENVYTSKYNVSARPDFSILIYPVISMDQNITHMGSRKNLIGENPTEELIQKYSLEKQVSNTTPVTFLMHAADDKAVPVENTLDYFLALKNHDVKTEMHIYAEGGHGFGLDQSKNKWLPVLKDWLAKNGWQ